jgi:hypothetical protein
MLLPCFLLSVSPLPLFLLGTGGDCRKYGPGNVCKDERFFGYSCARGLNCERQNQYYWQCVRPDKNNIDDGSFPVRSTASTVQALSGAVGSVASAASGVATGAVKGAVNGAASSLKVLKELDQCGGKGARCKDFGGCVDAPFAGYVCGQGLTCARQDEWYRQVGPLALHPCGLTCCQCPGQQYSSACSCSPPPLMSLLGTTVQSGECIRR